ncbi:hypothetical protein J2Y03_001539 [Neobacillus niacini]|uniref:hypothetical protein n=1 Tax=Neobacillus niacini TaxID=86668 RepID=UPI00285BEAE0|nr:hypothetical protein [Neobacillus niacini]MDR7076536.1 hypothetical protein [Neobacillus niacini]
MNKKLLAAIGISGTLMLGSVYSISANTSGYDLYKDALKKTYTAESATLNLKIKVEDNKKSILSAESIFKSDSVNQVNSISTRLANESEVSNMNMYKQDGNWFVMKDGLDTVYKMDTSKSPHHSNTAELKDDLENLIDVMTKNLQQQITVSEKQDGSHLIDLDLTGKEIPLTANALSTLMIKHAVMIQDNNETESSDFHIKAKAPELAHDITLKQIKLTAQVNKENYIEQQTVKVVVTGKDQQGTSHELVLNIDLNVSNYNQTTVAPVEISVEKVIEFNHGKK